MFHKALNDGDIHLIYTWEYTDAAIRLAASGFVVTDVGKLARQLDNNTLWMLVAVTPTWVAVGGLDTARLNNKVHVATTDPTITDDSSAGFLIDDFWINRTTRKFYTVTDVTVGAAVWTKASYDITTTVATPGIDTLVPTEKATRDALNTKWTIINANTTLYIATTGNDTTGDGSSGNPWLTINKAYSYLADKLIDPHYTVTIQLADGVYPITTLDVAHPSSASIVVTGTNVIAGTVSSIVSSSGSAGNWSIVLQLVSNAGLTVGDVVNIYSGYGGTNPYRLWGAHHITNVGGSNQITIHSYHGAAAPSGAFAGTIRTFKTVLSFSAANQITINNGNTMRLNNVGIYRAASSTVNFSLSNYGILHTGGLGIACKSYSGLARVFYNSKLDMTLSSGYQGVSADSGNYGIDIEYSSCAGLSNVVCNGAYIAIVLWGTSQVMYHSNGLITGCTFGIRVEDYSTYNGNPFQIDTCSSYGIFVNRKSCCNLGGVTVTGCGTGLYVKNWSFSFCNGSVSGNTTNYSPAVNTLGNNNAYNDSVL